MHGIKNAPYWPESQQILKDEVVYSDLTSEGGAYDFNIEKRPCEYVNDLSEEVFTSNQNSWVIDSKTRKPFCIVGADQGIVQPSSFVELMKSSLGEFDHSVVNAMTLNKRKWLVTTIELDNSSFEVRKGDKFFSYLVFSMGFDGKRSLYVVSSNERAYCKNSTTAILNTKGQEIRETTKCSKFVNNRLPDVSNNIHNALIQKRSFEQSLKMIDTHSVSLADAEKILTGFVGSSKTKGIGQKDKMLDLFQNGIKNEGRTYYDLFNGVTEYWTHHAVSDRVENRKNKMFYSSEFGTGADKKSGFLDLLVGEAGKLDNEAIEKIAAKGEKLLLEREADLARI